MDRTTHNRSHNFQTIKVKVPDWVAEQCQETSKTRGDRNLKPIFLFPFFPSVRCMCVCVFSYMPRYNFEADIWIDIFDIRF